MSVANTAVKILVPITIDDTTLTSTNVSENPPADWNAATAYVEGDLVVRPLLHKIYVRNVAGTTATAPELDSVNWTFRGASNPYAMFDNKNSTQTTNEDEIIVEITPGTIVNGLYLSNVDAFEVSVSGTDPVAGTILPLTTYSMQSPPTAANWYAYFFDPIRYKKSIYIPLPSYRNATFTVTITRTGGTAAVGNLVIGKVHVYGEGIEFGAGGGIISYSTNQTNQFGERELVPRGYSNKAQCNIWVSSTEADYFFDLMVSLRDTVCLYVLTEKFQFMQVLGFVKNCEPVINYEDTVIFNAQIEGIS
jgi:hypothetical protein